MLRMPLISICWRLLSIQAQNVDTVSKMTVWGKATVTQKADQVQFTIRFKSYGPSLQAVLESAQVKITDCVSKLQMLGYKAEDFQTTQFSQGESDEKAFLSSKKDYEISYEFRIKSDQVMLIDTTLRVLNAMKIDVDNIIFSLKDEFELTKRALKQAAANARVKADILAQELKTQILETLLVDEDADYYKLGSEVNIRGSRTTETGVALDGFLQQKLLSTWGARSAYFTREKSKTVTVKVLCKIK